MCYAFNSKTIITLLYNQDRSFLNAVVVNYTPESQYSWLGSILEAYLCIMAALGVVVWDAYHDCCTIESALFWQRFFIFVWKHQNLKTLRIPHFWIDFLLGTGIYFYWECGVEDLQLTCAWANLQITTFYNTFNQLHASIPLQSCFVVGWNSRRSCQHFHHIGFLWQTVVRRTLVGLYSVWWKLTAKKDMLSNQSLK